MAAESNCLSSVRRRIRVYINGTYNAGGLYTECPTVLFRTTQLVVIA